MNDNDMNDNDMNDNDMHDNDAPDAATRQVVAAMLTEFDPGARLSERLRLQQYSRNGVRQLEVLLEEESTALTASSFRSARHSAISGSLAGEVQLGSDSVQVRVEFEGDLSVGIDIVVRIGRPAADPIDELNAVTSAGDVPLHRSEERREVRWAATLPPGAFPTGVRPA